MSSPGRGAEARTGETAGFRGTQTAWLGGDLRGEHMA
jgi:hypothetical protein